MELSYIPQLDDMIFVSRITSTHNICMCVRDLDFCNLEWKIYTSFLCALWIRQVEMPVPYLMLFKPDI
jgi:hypothetical protein